MPQVPGHRWKDCREELDVDQLSAAEALGIAKRTYQNIETNPHHVVARRVILRAARYFGCSEQWLKGESEDPGEPPEERPAQPTSPKPEREHDPIGPPPRRNGDRDRRHPPRAALVEAS